MATTTNFGWETPDDTDLVKDGAAAMRTLGNSIDTSFVDLKGGTTNQVLAKNSNTDLDFKWVADATGIPATIFDAKGDIIAATAADTADRLAVGTNGQVLTADSTTATGLKWAAASSTPSFVGCSLYKSSGATITVDAITQVTWNSENFDTSGFHSTTTNTSRITIPSGKAGYYLVVITGTCTSGANNAGSVYLYKNGSAVTYPMAIQRAQRPTGYGTQMNWTGFINLAENDYIEAYYLVSGGSNATIEGGADYNTFSVYWLGA